MFREEDASAGNGNGFVDRRQMLKGMSALSLLTPSMAAAQNEPEFDKPKGLGLMALPDARFPMTYQHSVPIAVRVLTDYFAALSQRDLKAMVQYLHFPLGSYEGVDAVVVENEETFLAHPPASMSVTTNPERFTDHDGYMKSGCYDVLARLEVFNADPVRVNLSLTYDRYGSDGKRLLRCDGIYCLTNNDGKWAIQLMSTIFTPSDMVGTTYKDTEMACWRLRQDHCNAFEVNDADQLNRTRQPGKNISISDGNFALLQNNAINGNPLATFHARGVKTRLVVADVPESILTRVSETPDFSASARTMYAKLGRGIKWGYVSGTPRDTRVLHATVNKAHIYTGVTRFTPSGEEINTTMELDVVTYKKGHWGIQGSPLTFAYVTTHDRVNDLS